MDNRTLSTETQTTNTVTSPSGGWVTRSNISVMVNPNDRNKIISCNAINSELNDIKTQSHVLTVICKYRKISILLIERFLLLKCLTFNDIYNLQLIEK